MKKLFYGLSGLVIVAGLGIAYFWKDIQEIRALYAYAAAFEPDQIDENFRTLYQQYPSVTVARSGPPYKLARNIRRDALPDSFSFEAQRHDTRTFLQTMHLTGLIVLHDGQIIHEEYDRGNSETTPSIMMSVSKSMLSILMGVALEDGHIDSLDDPVVKYVPELKGTAYDGVTIQQVMDMSSGIRWNEDYDDLNSDLVRSVVAVLTGSQDEFVKQMPREFEPGTRNRYASIETHVLGMVLRNATGKPYEAYFAEELWSEIGAEGDAHILIDTVGQPVVYGGVNVRLRDLAKIGAMLARGGRNHEGEQIVSEDWIKRSTTPDAPHLQPGKNNPNSEHWLGYKNQWWIPMEPDGNDFTAIGIYGQFLYVNPKRNVVVAMTSAYPDYNKDGDLREVMAVTLFQAIAKHLSPREV